MDSGNDMNLRIKMVCLLVLVLVLSGCGSNKQDASSLLILEDESTSSVEGTQIEIELTEEVTEETTDEVTEETTDEVTEMTIAELDANDTIESSAMISVYICGAVYEAGVYELEVGSRVYHVIELAGGMTEDAMETYLNQAQELMDGQKLYVPTKEEVEEGIVEATNVETTSSTSNVTSDSGEVSSSDKVNINTASLSELMTLSGIGESKAQSIIDYRDSNGLFNNIEDLMLISGIKEATYSQIEGQICVD